MSVALLDKQEQGQMGEAMVRAIDTSFSALVPDQALASWCARSSLAWEPLGGTARGGGGYSQNGGAIGPHSPSLFSRALSYRCGVVYGEDHMLNGLRCVADRRR